MKRIGSESLQASIFAGCVAGSGRDPVPLMCECVEILRSAPNIELLRASPREVFNLVQAEEIGCDIITMTNDLISKIPLFGKDLDEFALDTVKMFARDSEAAGYRLQSSGGLSFFGSVHHPGYFFLWPNYLADHWVHFSRRGLRCLMERAGFSPERNFFPLKWITPFTVAQHLFLHSGLKIPVPARLMFPFNFGEDGCVFVARD